MIIDKKNCLTLKLKIYFLRTLEFFNIVEENFWSRTWNSIVDICGELNFVQELLSAIGAVVKLIRLLIIISNNLCLKKILRKFPNFAVILSTKNYGCKKSN